MNYPKIHKTACAALMLLAAGAFCSCSDEIELKGEKGENYAAIGVNQAWVRNALSPASSAIDFYGGATTTLSINVGLTKTTDHAVDAQLVVDAQVLADYNAANGTSYVMLPDGLATLRSEGNVLIPPTFYKADPVRVSVTSSDALTVGTTYALPLRLVCDDPDVSLQGGQSTCICYLKYQGARTSADKPGGYKMLACLEVNDVNPLNCAEIYLKDSDVPFFDYVVLFAANINFNAETGRAYVNCNTNVRHLLTNRDKYIKPLQDKGIKVILGMLGNGDQAGLANLTRTSAIYFAQELKAYVDNYGLDGIFFDDEYSVYAPGPGFTEQDSYDAAARLVFECKRVMPDKLMIPFCYGKMAHMPNPVDGLDPKYFVDFVASNYSTTGPGNADVTRYPGLEKKQILAYCQEFAKLSRVIYTTAEASKVASEGYGGTMIFGMNPIQDTWDNRMLCLNALGKGIWNEDVIIKRKHLKDW